MPPAKRTKFESEDSSCESDFEVIQELLDAALDGSKSTGGSKAAASEDRKTEHNEEEELESKKKASGDRKSEHNAEDNEEDATSKGDKLTLLIDWTTRDRLVSTIIHFTSFYQTKSSQISAECKESQIKASQELVGVLMSLPMKAGRSKDIPHESSLLTLELEHSFRNKLLSNLISYNDSLQYGRQFNDRNNRSQIVENYKMIEALTKLPIYPGDEAAKSVGNEGESDHWAG